MLTKKDHLASVAAVSREQALPFLQLRLPLLPEAVSLLTLQPVIDNKNPRICCQHLCWLLQQGLTQLTSCLQRRLTFDQLPALIIVSSTDSHSVGSFSHRNVRPLSPVGRPSLLPAQNGPRRAHRAGTPVLAHFPRASAPTLFLLQLHSSEYYEAWEPGPAPGLF